MEGRRKDFHASSKILNFQFVSNIFFHFWSTSDLLSYSGERESREEEALDHAILNRKRVVVT